MFNRTGLIAIAVVAAIVGWGAFYDDGSTPPRASARTVPPAKTERRPEIKDGGFDGS